MNARIAPRETRTLADNIPYQAIVTRYHGPTNSRGSRVSATAAAGRIYVEYDHALNSEQNHAAAARAYLERMNWNGRWVHGVLPNGSHVFVGDR